jgi:hypothetical protein
VGAWKVFELLLDLFFCLDVLLNFFTGFHDAGGLYVNSRRQIAGRYLRGWFVLDVLSSVPVDYLSELAAGNANSLESLRLVRMLRLVRLLKLFRMSRLTRFFARVSDPASSL